MRIVLDQGYSRNVLCILNSIYMFLFQDPVFDCCFIYFWWCQISLINWVLLIFEFMILIHSTFFNLQSLFNIFNNTFQSLMALFLLTTYVFMKPFPVIWDILRQSELMSNSSPLHPWYTCKVSKFSWVFVGNIKPQKLVYHETTMQQEKLWKIEKKVLWKIEMSCYKIEKISC
jgi:hypothetical protein